jgi:hypothetical protein
MTVVAESMKRASVAPPQQTRDFPKAALSRHERNLGPLQIPDLRSRRTYPLLVCRRLVPGY